ncbi:MAG: sugar phosphate nucleotidyltransferase [Patescibacteria group bacterium]|nr:sugar phosphate nucleotidyltransferase [Patescibacteria group bacterium]MDD5715240.1 sugar phosphate nucleotidyltransferase [Patescibacteria group bacterium]
MKIVILAGGGGTRLWPVSRKTNPKQIQPFVGNKTLLQNTYTRQRRGFKAEDIFISANENSAGLIRRQLPHVPARNIILEPIKRDTAAAIGLAAVAIAKRNPHEIMMTVGSDHFVKNEREYIRLIRLAEATIRHDPRQTLLVGIRPTYPETGYGYIKINKLYRQIGNDEIFYGQRFIEKPDFKTALRYVKSWDYLWNTNMFCWRVDNLLHLFEQYMPAHYKALIRIQGAIGTPAEKHVIRREFKRLKPVSIDYGIMEHTRKIIVIPAAYGWADIGHWRAVKDILAKTADENIVRGKHVAIDSKDNLIYSYTGRTIATAGLHGMIIIDMEDCLLVCPKEHAQDVKKIVDELKRRKLNSLL